MNVKVADLMVKNVVTTQPHKTVGHVKEMMNHNKISAVPVVNSENIPVGIITASDFHKTIKDTSPVSSLLQEKVFQVPQYNNIDVAAKIMLKHNIHHVLVTHEKELVGIISSFDLLKLIENNKFNKS